MTILTCSATTCMYNQGSLCSKGEISVNGASARDASETSCGSFREKSEAPQNRMTNSCGCEKIDIDCQAHNCTYNEQCKCTAGSIDVDGPGAKSSQQTKCVTFECKC